jgi:hypothetical protein
MTDEHVNDEQGSIPVEKPSKKAPVGMIIMALALVLVTCGLAVSLFFNLGQDGVLTRMNLEIGDQTVAIDDLTSSLEEAQHELDTVYVKLAKASFLFDNNHLVDMPRAGTQYRFMGTSTTESGDETYVFQSDKNELYLTDKVEGLPLLADKLYEFDDEEGKITIFPLNSQVDSPTSWFLEEGSPMADAVANLISGLGELMLHHADNLPEEEPITDQPLNAELSVIQL